MLSDAGQMNDSSCFIYAGLTVPCSPSFRQPSLCSSSYLSVGRSENLGRKDNVEGPGERLQTRVITEPSQHVGSLSLIFFFKETYWMCEQCFAILLDC